VIRSKNNGRMRPNKGNTADRFAPADFFVKSKEEV